MSTPLPVSAVGIISEERVLPYGAREPRRAVALATAFGIASIVIALTSILFNLVLVRIGLDDYGLVMSSRKPRYVPPRLTLANPAALATDPPAGPVAMQPAEREALIDSMTKRKPLSAARRRQLDAMLAAQGTKLGADRVLWRDTQPHPDPGEPDGDHFKTGKGELAVYDDRAVFSPNYSPRSIRVFAPDPAGATGSATAGGAATGTPSDTAGGLSATEIDAVVREVDAVTQASHYERFGLTPKQLAALQAELSAPGQQLVYQGNSQDPVYSCYFDGSRVSIEFSNGSMLALDAKGKVTSQRMPAPISPPFTTSSRAIAAFIATSVLSLALAAVLLVAGIMALRRSPASRRLHLLYARAKIPLAAAGMLCFAYVSSRMSADVGAGAGDPFGLRYQSSINLITWAVLPAALGCVYPLVLLLTANTEAVKACFRSPAAAPAVRSR